MKSLDDRKKHIKQVQLAAGRFFDEARKQVSVHDKENLTDLEFKGQDHHVFSDKYTGTKTPEDLSLIDLVEIYADNATYGKNLLWISTGDALLDKIFFNTFKRLGVISKDPKTEEGRFSSKTKNNVKEV